MRRSLVLKVLLLAGVLALLVALIPAAGAQQVPDGRDNQNPGPVVPGPEGGSVDSGANDADDQRTRDHVINDDLIVDGSACIGFDCVNGESFGFDTLRLKENNLRIKFQDTSNSASFPTNDWQITANDSSNGGANKFSIDDIDGGRTPFTLEASAPSHSLYVDNGGRVGFGTSNPVVEVHSVNGDSPTLRLEQNGSSGFTPQTWDVAGNEANFFIRDATNGSRLPFKIRPAAPTDSIEIEADGDVLLAHHAGTGNVSIGNIAPTERLNVDGSAIIADTTTPVAARTLLSLENNGSPQFELTDTDGGDTWRFGLVTSANPDNNKLEITPTSGGARYRYFRDGRFDIRNGSNTIIFDLDDTGDLTITGVLSSSDRELKTDFSGVDAKAILASVEALDVSTWAFKEQRRVRHIGPVAQDWYAAFGMGSTETAIHQTDVNGVVLSSIQALAAENDALAAENKALAERLAALEKAVAGLSDG